jgi:uncharacterized protein with HEPN domain
MNNEISKFLFDIQISIESIENYIGEKKDFNVYKSNKMLRRAVEREFEIIGEALKCIEKIDSTIEISGKRQIIGLRNRVIHGYDKIDDELVWGIIVKHLPILKNDISKLIQ